MSTSGDNNTTNSAQNFENYVPHVAYTLGDIQPVRSTYIAHDPYFFMDVDEVTLEEELLRDLERDFGAKDSTRYEDNSDSRFLDILINFDENLDYIMGEEPSSEFNLLNTIDILESSRYAAALLEFAAANNIEFVACPSICAVEYDRSENVILYQPTLSELEAVKGMITALRTAWQNYQGALLQPVALYPDHAVFINRAQKADIAGALIRSAWELELAGYGALWANLVNSSMRDLTHAYGREATLDFRSLNSGRAGFAVFESWFLSDRSKAADTGLIRKLLSDYSGHQFEDEDMSQLVVIDLVKAMGEMPYGKNYLSGHIPNLLTDPIFTEVRERAASNFLWFIKFEKTFTEVEQTLQNTSSQSRDILSYSGDAHQMQDGTLDEQSTPTPTGLLIPFPTEKVRGNRTKQQNSNAANESTNQSGEVIPFDIAVRPFNGNFLS